MHDPHARPPESIRERFKELRKRPASQIDVELDIIDPYNPDHTKVSPLPDAELPDSSGSAIRLGEFGIDPSLFTLLGLESLPCKAFEINGLPGTLG
jgi:hypothetical protein